MHNDHLFTNSPPENPVHNLHRLLEMSYPIADEDGFDENISFGACLRPLLAALNWAGEHRHLHEALPHYDKIDNIHGLRAVLARLNFETYEKKITLSQMSANHFPCLYMTNNQDIYVILSQGQNGNLVIFNGQNKQFQEIETAQLSGIAYIVKPLNEVIKREDINQIGWLQLITSKFKKTGLLLLGLTFAINTLSLTIPIYIMAVYDKAIGAKSFSTLVYLAAGALLILLIDQTLRAKRAHVIAYLGARLEALLSIGTFQQLLNLPVTVVESAPIGAQLTRLRQFDSLRDLFTGSLAATALDIPFFVVFLTATFFIGGILGWIPTALIVVYAILTALTIPITKIRALRTLEARTECRNFAIEMTTKQRAIYEHGASDIWLERYSEVNAKYLENKLLNNQTNFSIQTITQALMLIAGAATIGLGTLEVIEEKLSIGALIAVMALIWRILAPIQTAFLNLSRIFQIMESARQMNQLMRFKPERETSALASVYRQFKGKLEMKGVSFRYNIRSDAVLKNVNLRLMPGEIVAITGPNGSGKSTLLKLIARLYQPLAGEILLDDLDIRQLDVAELRHRIGYVPQQAKFFYGSITQNMKLASPQTSKQDILKMLEELKAMEELSLLPDGIETRLSNAEIQNLSPNFQQQLILARAFLKESSVYILDEPGNNLSRTADIAFMNKIKSLKGKKTIIMTTHRPSHMRLADRVIVLSSGLIRAEGPADKIISSIFEQNTQKLAKP